MMQHGEETFASEECATISPVRTLKQTICGVPFAVVTGGTPPDVEGIPGAGVASLRISPDAVALMRWLETQPALLPSGDALFLELGAGVGCIGLACAALCPESFVVLTDVPDLAPVAQRSIEVNVGELAHRVVVRSLPFGDIVAFNALTDEFHPLCLSNPVVVLGAGIFYWECVYTPLAETLKHLCDAGGYALLGYFRRDWKVERRFWTKLLPRLGLTADVLWEGTVDQPGDTASFAPACSRTPGEWNARVYHVKSTIQEKTAGDDAPSEFEPWLAYKECSDRQGQRKNKGKSGQRGR